MTTERSGGPDATSPGSALVVGEADGIARVVARRLGERGPVVLSAAVDLHDDDGASLALACREAVGSAPLRLVVHAHLAAGSLVARPLAALDDAGWDAIAEAPVRALLATLRVVHRSLEPGATIVVVVPSVGILGEAGLVAASTAAEAQRGLAKSAARAWAAAGIAVHVVAVAPSGLGEASVGSGGTRRPPLGPLDPEDAADVVLAAAALPAVLIGATLFADADGGEAMLP